MTHGEKLNKNYQFRYVYRHGKCVGDEMFSVTFCTSKQVSPKVGLSVSKKNGKATVRNRIKRLMRECMRTLYPDIKPHTNMVVTAQARHDFGKGPAYRDVCDSLCRLLARAGLLKTKD